MLMVSMLQKSELWHGWLGELVFCVTLSVLLTDVYADVLEGSGQCQLEIISYDWCGWTEEKHINFMQDSQCSGTDVNLTLPPKASVDCCRYTNLLILISQDRQVEG
jgi:hypothetical protein